MAGDTVKFKEVEDTGKMTFWLAVAIAATVVGSPWQFGYNMGVVNAPIDVIKQFYGDCYNKTFNEVIDKDDIDWYWAVTVSVYAIGGMIGSFIAGFFADLFGRKKALMLNNILILIAGSMIFSAKYVTSFPLVIGLMVGGRIVVGINAGANTIIGPMYTAEIAPVKLRGTLGTMFQFGVVLAIVVAQVLGLDTIMGNAEYWNYLMGLLLFIPATIQICLFLIVPESPRYILINKSDKEGARAALQKLRGCTDVDRDIEQLEQENALEKAEASVGVMDIVTSPGMREPLIIALTLQVAQQLSGINAVNFYSTKIFKAATLSTFQSKLATIGTGVSQLLMIMPTIFLMDRAGRRILMLIGLGGMCLFSGGVVLFTLLTRLNQWFMIGTLISVFGIMGAFSVAPGPVPWLITAELFSQGPRPTAMSMAGTVNWVMTFIVGLIFQYFLNLLKDYTFLMFMVLDYIFWLFVFLYVPETKNRHIDDIVESFRRKSKSSQRAPKLNVEEANAADDSHV